MNSLLSPAEAIARIPGWNPAKVRIEELKGGLTNRSFAITRDDDRFVLRLDAAHTAAFNLDRTSEAAILKSAAAAGLAPEIVFADEGILLSRYLPGRVWSAAEFEDTHNIDALCELLRRVHVLPLCGIRLDGAAVARRYADRLQQRLGLHTFALRCTEIIAGVPVSDTVRCCHNDVIAQNIISTPELKLLDWEYASDNDPLFDLASLVGFHNLGAETANALLDSYAGGADSVLREQLRGQIRLYDAIQWLWLANRHKLSRNSQQALRLEDLQQRIG
jgi:thiamine kinase